MSLIVQVAGGGNPPPPKGGSLPVSSHTYTGTHHSLGPPPAHVTQLTSNPAHSAPHVVQHHPQPRHAHRDAAPHRSLPLSPHRNFSLPLHQRTGSHHQVQLSRAGVSPVGGHSHVNLPSRLMMNGTPNAPTHISHNLPLLQPSPAHQILPTNINSPSLIPQNIPQGLIPIPRIPISIPNHLSPHPPSPRSPIFPLAPPPAPPDTTILPPHVFKKLIRTTTSHHQQDDDLDMGESPPTATTKRGHVSPKQRQRNCFSNLALQDHNYCAAPPPSPTPRTPTPPPSPYPILPPAHMGVPPLTRQEESLSDQQSFTFGIAGYGASPPRGPAPYPSPPRGVAPYPSPPRGVAPYPSPQYVGNTAPPPGSFGTPISRMMVNRQTIEDAGVGPMTPLVEEDNRASEERDSRPEVDGGEETETAPEADDEVSKRSKPPQKQHKKKLIQKHHKKKFIQKHHLEDTETLPLPSDDSVTRCICEFQHDDGYMICCDKCAVWQHVVCMGLDRNNIPEEYLCEKCSPRQVDKKRARMVQTRREREIFNNAGSSDDDAKRSVLPGMSGLPGLSGLGKPKKGPLPGSRKGPGGKKLMKSGLDRGEGLKPKGPKKNYKRRVFSKDGTKGEMGGKKLSPRKARRKSTSATDTERDEEKNDDPAMMLRSWIDTYEEAVTNHYSQELRSRLERIKVPATCQVKPKDVTGDRCNVSLRGNGMKVLTANSHIPANTPITECRGKYMLSSQYRDSDGEIKSPVNMPFVLIHRLCPDLEVCVDSKTYGNNSRFCRRSNQTSPVASHNAEVRHHLDKGSLHLYIVSCCIIEKNQEILLPPEPKNGFLPPLSISDELREINKANGLPPDDSGGGPGGGERQPRKSVGGKTGVKRRLKREAKKFAPPPTSSSDEERESTPPSPRKTRLRGASAREVKEEVVKKDDRKEVNVVVDKVPEPMDQDIKVIVEPPKPPSEVVVPPEKVESEEKHPEEAVIIKSGDNPVIPPDPVEITPLTPKQQNPVPQLTLDIKEPSSPEKRCEPSPGSGDNPNIKSPGKLGLPDASGLIVGVNTIDYDVSIRNKAQTREEKKMEMIMKAIEQMERAEARKRQEGEFGITEGSRPGKRRRSNSTAKHKDNTDSALDASSADEANIDLKALSRRGHRRRAGPSAQAPQRRRSRAKSGDSQSAEISADEGGVTSVECQPQDLGVEAHQEFRFPKHKKHMVAEYLGGNADRYETVAKKIVHIIKNDPSNFSSEGLEDDVSSNYLRGSRSPPGIANHLLRSTSTTTIPAPPKSPVQSIGCSAKKRWLRAAMSEDHSEVMMNGGEPGGCSPAPISPEPSDHYTPLKKRRLASYKESGEDSPTPPPDITAGIPASVADKFVKGLPNGLKKRLISNLVIDSVLDKALDDMCPEINNKSIDLNVDDDKASVKNCFKMDIKKTVQDNLEDVIKNEIKQELESEEINLKMESDEARSPLGKKQKGGMKKKKVVEKKETLDSLFIKRETSEPSREQELNKGATNNQIKIEPSESKDKCAKSSEKVPKTKSDDNWGHLSSKFPKEELDIKREIDEIPDKKPATTGDIIKSEKSRETGEKVSIKDLVTADKVSIKSEKTEECKAATEKLQSTTKHKFNHAKVEQNEDTKNMFNNKDTMNKFSNKSKEALPPKPSEVINKIAEKLNDKVSEVVGDMTPSDTSQNCISKPRKVQTSTDRSQEKVEKLTTAAKEPSTRVREPSPRATEPSPRAPEQKPRILETTSRAPEPLPRAPEPSPRASETTPRAPEPPVRVLDPVSSILEPVAKLPEPSVKLPEPAQHSVFKSFFSTELSVEEIDRQLETRREQLARESSMTPLSPRPDSLASSDSNSRPPSSASPHSAPSHATPPPTRVTPPPDSAPFAPFPPKEKKRMSLADYKKRRQVSVTEHPAYPDRGTRVSPLDEVFNSDKPVSLPVLPGLEPYRHTDNPVLMTQLEKLEKLEKEHKENKMKARHHHRPETSNRSSAPVQSAYIPRPAPPPVLAPDRPREDLTERLRKEFGLDVDESEEEKSGDEAPTKLMFGGFSRDSSSMSSKSGQPVPVSAPQGGQPQRRTSQESSSYVNRDSNNKSRRNNSYQRSNYTS